jgi:hypothetical protein
MSEERRNALVEAGRQAMADYFDKMPVGETKARGLPGAGAARAKAIADRIAAGLLQQR